MINQFDPNERDMLSKIQGNILKGHGRDHTANIFIIGKPGKVDKVKKWFNELADDNTGIIKSGYEQLKSAHLWKEKQIDSGPFACIHISKEGYFYLNNDNEDLVKSKFDENKSFLNGMRVAGLGDPFPDQWDEGLNLKNHFMLLIADKNEEKIKEMAKAIKEDIKQFAEVTTTEYGNVIKNEVGAGLEHFGYVDGVSQPVFFEDEYKKFKEDNHIIGSINEKYNPIAKKELVLVDDPFVNVKNALGSFFVFRKLEQNVRGFKEAEEELADKLKLKGEDKERAGAMIVGRFEDGTPIQFSNEAGMIDGHKNNNFNYEFADESKCPYHAHIRKSNPRDDLKVLNESLDAKNHVMARRGIPFGKRTDDMFDGKIDTKPTRGVGLLFMSYQASIEKQFEIIQKRWANNEDFISREKNDAPGLDLIIGQGVSKKLGGYASKWGDKTSIKQFGFDKFVTMKGGEYFFAPSISFLKNL
jgi:Dyp-type peroxidase family